MPEIFAFILGFGVAMIAIAYLTPDDYTGLVSRLALLESRYNQLEHKMATEVQAIAELTTQVTELTAAVTATTTFITDLKAQVAALTEAVANSGDVSGEVARLATLVDDAEKALLAAIAPAA